MPNEVYKRESHGMWDIQAIDEIIPFSIKMPIIPLFSFLSNEIDGDNAGFESV